MQQVWKNKEGRPGPSGWQISKGSENDRQGDKIKHNPNVMNVAAASQERDTYLTPVSNIANPENARQADGYIATKDTESIKNIS